jgi:polyvinyl alcohol dehydrogenase (cytochrome)
MTHRSTLVWSVIALVTTAAACGDENDGGEGATSAPGTLLPCDVAQVVEQNCVACHGVVKREGAPMTLLTAADFQAPRQNQTVGDRVMERIASAARPMPPKPRAMLTPQQIGVLTAWIQGGAMGVADGCMVADSSAVAGSGGTTGGSGGMTTATGGSGGMGSAGHAGMPAMMHPDSGMPTMMAPATEWPMYGGDLTNSRANLTETTISPSNVGTLTRKWKFDGPSISSTPVIAGGVVYVAGWDAKVYALAEDDGSTVWTATMPNLIDSSVSVNATQVFVSDAHGSVHALDRSSGAIQWSHPVDMHPDAHLWSSPIFIADENLVVVGVASHEEVLFKPQVTFRGSVVALDATSGMERWRFSTTQSGDGPGVAIWGTASVDTKRKLLYIGTGNNYAAPSSELSDSMLAINYQDGTVLWHSQFLADDVFSLGGATGPDYDIGSTANLFTAGGKDLIGIGVKSGLYAAFDRDTGMKQWSAQVSPGGIYGGLISAPAYAMGSIFVASNDPDAGQTIVAALDAASGNVNWKHELPMQTFSGVSYANGIAFVGTMAGTLAALDATSGDVLWTETMPDVAGSPVAIDGKLFVPFGYQLTLADGQPGVGGVIVYALP